MNDSLKSIGVWLPAALLAAALLGAPAMGAINSVPSGGAVFIGEQGLDITASGAKAGSVIGWWSGGRTLGSPPTATYTITDPANVYISPDSFAGMTGPWYLVSGMNLAFSVNDPEISLRIIDETSNFEVTGMATWVPKGDVVGFRIDNNVYQMSERGVPGAPVTIHVRSPDGAEFTTVSANSLVDIPVSSATYPTGAVWDTGSYQSGNYAVWAVCNANGMNDNYNVAGKTTSSVNHQANMLLQSVNPLITSTVTGTPTTVPATTVPATKPSTPVPTTIQTTPGTTVITTVPTTPPTMPPTTVPPPVTTTAPGFGLATVLAGLGLVVFLAKKF